MLRGVVRVDANVFVGQVGGPESAGAFALMEMNVDGKLGLLEVGVGGVFVVFKGAAAATADGQLAEGDVDGFGVYCSAGVADGGNEAAPVGVAAGPCGLDERRMSDGFGDAECIGVRGGAVDAKFDNVRDAFAVGHDLAGE